MRGFLRAVTAENFNGADRPADSHSDDLVRAEVTTYVQEANKCKCSQKAIKLRRPSHRWRNFPSEWPPSFPAFKRVAYFVAPSFVSEIQ